MSSCKRCQRRKKRCDHARPACSSCAATGDVCVYEVGSRPQFIFCVPSSPGSHGGILYMRASALDDKVNASSSQRSHPPSDDNVLVDHIAFSRRTREDIQNYLQQRLASSNAILSQGSDAQRHLSATGLRISMLDDWSRSYFPTKGGGMPAGYDHMAGFLVRSAAGQAAIDLGTLAQLGHVKKDLRLVRHASVLYPRTLGILRRNLQTLDIGTFLAVVHCIQINEGFVGIGSDEEPTWHNHTAGIIAALEAHQANRKSGVSLDSGLQHALVANFREFGIWQALRDRTGIPQYARAWSSDASDPDSADAPFAFDGLVAHTPTILEACRWACIHANAISSTHVIDILTQISTLEGSLHRWKADSISVANDPVCPSPSLQAPTTYQESLFLIDPAIMNVCYWACILALQRARLDLHGTFKKLHHVMRLASCTEEGIKFNGNDAAMALLRGAKLLMRGEHGYMGVMKATAPLAFAHDWFLLTQYSEGLAACSALQRDAASYGVRIAKYRHLQ